MGGFWESEGGGGGGGDGGGGEEGGEGGEEAVLVVHWVHGQDSGQEVKTRAPVESCKCWGGGPKTLICIKLLDTCCVVWVYEDSPECGLSRKQVS